MIIKIRKIVALVVSMSLILSVFMPGLALAGSIINLSDSDVSFTEGDNPVYVDQNVTVTSSTSFDDGYVRFSVDSANASDNFSMVSDADPNANGAISFSGSTVYLGDGSGKDAIGVIDGTEDGQSGRALKINFSSPMANSGFENGSEGWTINSSEYRMSGDSLYNASFETSILNSDGNNYLHLSIRGTTNSYGTGHGPTATSSYFEAYPGDTIAFDWKAARTSDYYDVYAYLINDATGQIFQVLYQRGSSISTWQKKEILLNSNYLSNYSDKLKFLFVCGTYDASGGRAVGSVMDIDNVRVVKTFATAAVVENVISQVKYQNTSDDPAGLRTITVQTHDQNGVTDSDTRNINITPVNDAPTLGTNTGLTVDEDATVTITSSKLNESDPDDSGVSCLYTVTANVSNGTLKKGDSILGVESTFTQGDIDNSYITYTHNGSETTSDAFSFTLVDGGEDGAGSDSGTFSITVTPVNDAPTLTANTVCGVVEGESCIIDAAHLSSSDADNEISELLYKLTGTPSNGDLQKSGSVLGVNDTFTQSDIDNNYITYTHDGGETTTDSFTFSLSDGSATQNATFTFSVSPVNDSPVIGTNTGMTVSEAMGDTITSSMLNEDDPDDSGSGSIYTLTNCTDHGVLKLGENILGLSDQFTQADIDNGLVTYEHNGGESTSDAFTVVLSDGGEDDAGIDSATFAITIVPVNDAPVLDTKTTMNIDEGDSTAITSSLLSSSDEDDDYSGFAYTVTKKPENGDLKLSGETLGSGDTFSQADINGGRLIYVHDGDETTSDSFDFRIEDGGENGAEAVLGTFNITITPVNDASVIGTNNGLTLDEAAVSVIETSKLLAIDPDDTALGLIYTITDKVDNGTLKLGEKILKVGDKFTQADIDSGILTYRHNGGETTIDSFAFTLSDGGEDGAAADSGVFSITITPVNDAPVIYNQTFDVDENASAASIVGKVVIFDAENDAMLYRITDGNTAGAFSIDENDGTITVLGDIDHDTIQQYVLDISVKEASTSEHYGENIKVTINVNNLHDVPPTPIAANLCDASDSGVSQTDNITNDTTPTFDGAEGAAMSDSIVKLYADGKLIASTTANADGSWVATSINLADGTYDITITSTDNGGDISEKAEPIKVTIDTIPPVQNSAPYLASGGITTDDRTPEIAGSNEAFAVVHIYGDNGILLGTSTGDEKGSWVFTVAQEDKLSVGSHIFDYTLTDYAGNVSAHSPGLGIIVNDPPTGTDGRIITNEDTAYLFDVVDFGYSDVNEDVFEQIKILSLPENGNLEYYNGSAWQNAELRQVVTAAAIDSGYLRFVPENDKNGIGYAAFMYKVHDGIDYGKQGNTLTIDVTPINDVHVLAGIDGDSYDYLEDQGAVVIDSGQNTDITDIDNINYNGGALIVTVITGGTVREDVIGIETKDGVITLSSGMNEGSQVSIGGILVGTIDSLGGKGEPLTVNFSVGSTEENVEMLIRHITYENTNHNNPSRLMRTIEFVVEDKDGLFADARVKVNIERTEKASVNTTAVSRSDITVSSIVLGGKVTSNGRAKVTEYGFVYSTKASFNPETEGTRVVGTLTGSGAFEAKVSRLEQNTKYYFAAYAKNSEGTSYGSVLSATTYRNSDKDGDGNLDNPNADSDGDGVSDGDEIEAGADPDDADSTPSDSDGDGRVDNIREDSDGDGVSDGDEAAAGSDPDDAASTPSDKDGNGIVDDPSADSDGDGISDGDEIAVGTNPDDASSMPDGQISVLQSAPTGAPKMPSGNGLVGMNSWQSMASSTSTAITLAWDSVTDADYYLIWNTSGASDTLVGMVGINGTSCQIKGLSAGTEYSFVVAAYSMSGNDIGPQDMLLGSDSVLASTHDGKGLPLDEIMSEVTGGSPSTSGGNRIDLTGQITDENGMPLAGVTVELHSTPRTAVTDSNGWYLFDEVELGEHTVFIYYGDTVTETLLDLQIESDETAEGIETTRDEDGSVSYCINSPEATLVLNMSMDQSGELTVEHFEAQPVIYLNDGGLLVASGGALYFVWWAMLAIVAVVGVIFFILFKRRRKKDEEESTYSEV